MLVTTGMVSVVLCGLSWQLLSGYCDDARLQDSADRFEKLAILVLEDLAQSGKGVEYLFQEGLLVCDMFDNFLRDRLWVLRVGLRGKQNNDGGLGRSLSMVATREGYHN